MCQVSGVICHMSYVICHVSCVTCHMSHVMCHMSFFACRLSPVFLRHALFILFLDFVTRTTTTMDTFFCFRYCEFLFFDLYNFFLSRLFIAHWTCYFKPNLNYTTIIFL